MEIDPGVVIGTCAALWLLVGLPALRGGFFGHPATWIISVGGILFMAGV